MRLLTLLLLFFSLSVSSQTTSWNQPLETALQQQQDELPQEKLYVQTDRTLYYPGEIVWLAAYLVGSDNTTTSALSDLVQVELLRPNGSPLNSKSLIRNGAGFTSDIQLPSDLPGGTYTLRAYTNYQGNFGDRYVYEKTIQVQRSVIPRILLKLDLERETYGPGDTVSAFFSARDLQDAPLQQVSIAYTLRIGAQVHSTHTIQTNQVGTADLTTVLPDDLNTQDVQLSVRLQHAGQQEQISRPVGVTLNNISLKLLPEGGEWIKGLPCKMAFIAKDEIGEPVDVAGTLYDANDDAVLRFTSLHDGMGSFVLPEDIAPPCRVRLDKPVAGRRVYPLPDPVVGAWQLQAGYDLLDKLTLHAHALQEEELQIAIRSNGQLGDCVIWPLIKGDQELAVDVSGFPMGIAQITVFDQQLRPIWERLVFLHPDRSLKVDIETNKDQYSYRDAVKLDVSVSDHTGQPIQGVFSLAVSDDRLHSFADDKQPNILAQLLLSGELSGKIHEPNFYFKPEEENATAALDLLMLTHGWRRFHWLELLQRNQNDWQAMLQHQPASVVLGGTAMLGSQYLRNQKIKLRGNKEITIETDAAGRFRIPAREQVNRSVVISHRGFTEEVTLNYSNPVVNGQNFSPGAAQKRMEGIILAEQEGLEVPISDTDLRQAVALSEPFEDVSKEQLLDEVVVTGLGISRRKALSGYAVTTIEAHNHANLDNAADIAMELDMEEEVPELQIISVPNRFVPVVRQFAFPNYNEQRTQEQDKPDHRKTLYWNGQLETNAKGKASVEFFTADEMTTYRAILEGMGNSASPAYGEYTFSAAPPVAVQCKFPVYATTGDTIQVPILVQNNTNSSRNIPLTAQLSGEGLKWLQQPPATMNVEAGQHQEVKAQLLVVGKEGQAGLELLAGKGHRQVKTAQELTVYPTGFPRRATASAKKMQARYDLPIDAPIPGTVRGQLMLFPDLTGELLAGVDAILAEPHGCFEQTSSANYPNIMALQYLKEQEQLDDDTRTKAWGLLERGYDRLSGYEVSSGGFSLWGQAPAIPVLTAFGLLQFTDLDQVWPKVDPELIPRTVKWLTANFEQNNNQFTVDQAYIFYALTRCSDYRSRTALAKLNEAAEQQNIAYMLAIAARLNLLYGDRPTAKQQIDQLLSVFDQDAFANENQSPSFVHTIGSALSVELMAWTILAALEYDYFAYDLEPVMETLLSRRYSGGRFGPTQPTVMALKAITAYEKASARPQESGKLIISVNQQQPDTLAYSPDQQGQLVLDNFEQYLQAGNNSIDIRFAGTTEPLPYNLDINWQTAELPDETSQNLALRAVLEQNTMQLSESVRYRVEVENLLATPGYAPLVQLALPAGLQWQMWQLKEMKDRGEISYYEMHGHYLVLYFEEIAPRSLIKLNFDLIAVTPGHYQAPATNAYLYYQDDAKSWIPGSSIHILP